MKKDGSETRRIKRNIKTSVDEYNESHEQQIDRHVIEKCVKSKKVFKYYHGNRWIINYD